MRIISNYHDYYDTCLSYGIDPKCIYKRDEVVYQSNEKQPVNINLDSTYFERVYFHMGHDARGIIWFCGKCYPYIEYQSSKVAYDHNNLISYPVHYCYSKTELDEVISKEGSKDEIDIYFAKKKSFRHWHRTTADKIEKFFNETTFNEKTIIDELCRLGVPCLKWIGGSTTLNPKLKDMQFYKVKDAFTTFQDLSMFISGVMGGQAPPMVPISDQIRKEKHGFDEWSFRKKVR